MRTIDRRRFLSLAATAGLFVAGCGPALRESSQAPQEASRRPETERAPKRDTSPGGTGSREQAGPAGGEERPAGEGVDADEASAEQEKPAPSTADEPPSRPGVEDLDPDLVSAEPRQWGETVAGVRTHLDGSDAVALTLDACGGPGGDGYDHELLGILRELEVPATLFINARWARANPEVLDDLAGDPLFEIANHGTEHRPLSVDGRSAYGTTGTASPEAVIEEVWACQRLLTERTGTAPRFFRSGTAHYDEVAVGIVGELDLEVAGYSVLGDAGATFSAAQVRQAVSTAGSGSIVLLHMNHPGSGTAQGVGDALPELLDRGVTFTRLGEHPLR